MDRPGLHVDKLTTDRSLKNMGNPARVSRLLIRCALRNDTNSVAAARPALLSGQTHPVSIGGCKECPF